MKRRAILVAVLSLISSAASAQYSSSTLKGVDLYRSDLVSVEQAQAKVGVLLDTYARLRYEGRKSRVKEQATLKAQIEAGVKSAGDFAFVQLYYGDYVTSASRWVYITLDVVDAKDAKSRMPFRAPPKGHVEDPGGLLAAWQQYDQLGLTLSGQGQRSAEDHPSCPGFYCRWGSFTPDLAGLESRLAQGAEAQKGALRKLAAEDAEPSRRAAALYCLSYMRDGAEVTKTAQDALSDPSEEVRAAALQILSDVAIYHHDVLVDINRIIAALDYPTVSDRSKALGMLVGLAELPAYRPFILSRATPLLMPLLKLDQPNIHDLAFTLLAVLSQESYDGRDYDAWAKWIEAQASGAAPAAPKKPKR